jgi:hypothetical protein
MLLFESSGSYATSTLSSTEKEQRNPNFQYLSDCRLSSKQENNIRFTKYFKLILNVTGCNDNPNPVVVAKFIFLSFRY